MYLLLVSIAPRHFANNLLLVVGIVAFSIFSHGADLYGERVACVKLRALVRAFGFLFFESGAFVCFFVFLFKHALIQLTFFGNGGSYD